MIKKKIEELSLDEILKQEYPFYIKYEEGRYILNFPDLNIEVEGIDVVKLIKDAIFIKNEQIKKKYENHESISMPNDKYSGELRIRMPKSLHKELSILADIEGVSLNQFIVFKLTEALNFLPNQKENTIVEVSNDIKRFLEVMGIFDINGITLKEFKKIIDEMHKREIMDKRTYKVWKSYSDAIKLEILYNIKNNLKSKYK